MKTTTPSGCSFSSWLVDSRPQSTSTLFEMPVPTCGSRITRAPLPASRRARSWSSGIDIESPVTSSVCRARFGGGLPPTAEGSNASGVTGGTNVELVEESRTNEPPLPPLLPGESQAGARWPTSPRGRRAHALERALGKPRETTPAEPGGPPGQGPERGRARRHEPRQEVTRQAEVLRAEQDPPEHHEMERHEPAQPRGPARPALPERVLGHQPEPVEAAPEHERPRRAVPQAAEHHRDHQVARGV